MKTAEHNRFNFWRSVQGIDVWIILEIALIILLTSGWLVFRVLRSDILVSNQWYIFSGYFRKQKLLTTRTRRQISMGAPLNPMNAQ